VTFRSRQCRPWADCERDLAGVRSTWPQPEPIVDTSRGEQRLAAEVALATSRGMHVPTFAYERALETLKVLAKQ
jgi:hypothetical protein